MKKLVLLDASTLGEVPNLTKLQQFGHLDAYPVTLPHQTAERIKDADIVLTNKVKLDKTLLPQAPQLKLICIMATGMNNVDLEAAEQLGISVKNVAGYSTHSVAQHTFALLLYLLNQTGYYHEYVTSGKYSQQHIFTHLGKAFWQLQGKTFGILGLGNIGSQVAQIAQAFGCEVIYHSTSGKNTQQPYRQVDLETFLDESDIISVHCPLNEKTHNLLNYTQIQKMKPSSILINTSRGGIIHEAALAKALDDHLIAAAAIDVFEKEPLEPSHPYLNIKNKEKLVLTPHMAWGSIESRTELVDLTVQNIQQHFAGKEE
ncbi:D-2-hydroxyacid dehydrogenase [Rapidithrix thailandica]|uniref:D-2-hydroxyacid dehydrogenase n=1 Tax=Rapidithrix thailandica TaxID=413964 RepID=A0AAW9RZI7_9BACT